MELARQHHMAGNLVLADRTYRDILESVPDHFPALHYLGLVNYQRANLPEAVRLLARAVEIQPDDAECRNNYAIMLAESGRPDDALREWGAAEALKPDFADIYSNRANTLWHIKRFEEAEKNCRRALDLKPDYFDAMLNLGNALMSQDKADEAIAVWKKAIDANPSYAKAYNNVGNALRDQGKIRDSEEYCRKAVELDPKYPDALNNLGNALRDQGKAAEAEGYYRKAVSLRPNYAQAHNNLAVALMDQARFDEAATSSRYATAFRPEYGEAYGNLSIALREMGEMDEAEVAARQSLSLRPDSLEAHLDYADLLFMLDRYDEAEAALEDALKLRPDSPRVYLKLSGVLERANRIEEAIEMTARAAALNPEMPDAWHRQGVIYYMANRPAEAIAAIDKALALRPGFAPALATLSEIEQSLGNMERSADLIRKGLDSAAEASSLYFTLSKTKKFTPDDPDLKKMQELAENINRRGSHNATALHFALSKAYEDTGDYDRAFEHLKAGNDARRRLVRFDPAQHAAFYEMIRRQWTDGFIKSLEGRGFDSDLPVLIVGMPRSGTTLTEQIISSHPDVFGAGELAEFGMAESECGPMSPDTAAAIGRSYVERLRKYDAKALRITDKMPGNFTRLGAIAAALPGAKIIHCRRDPVDTCLSCYKQLFARGQYWSYTLKELAMEYRLYHGLMEHWRTVLPGRFIEVDYETTVSDFETTARRLIDHAGLPWNDACLEPHKQERSVLTASKNQVRKPVYRSSVKAWKRYEKQLQPLIEGLGELAG